MDNVHFQDIYVQNNSKGEVEEIVFDDTPTRYVRIQSIKRGTNYGPSLWEFQLYGTLYEKHMYKILKLEQKLEKMKLIRKQAIANECNYKILMMQLLKTVEMVCLQ